MVDLLGRYDSRFKWIDTNGKNVGVSLSLEYCVALSQMEPYCKVLPNILKNTCSLSEKVPSNHSPSTSDNKFSHEDIVALGTA